MVGEIRDRETAQIAIEAALTGHLVLSTLHTNDSTGAVARLIEMGIEPFLMTSSLLGVVAQRLVRCLCPACKKPRSLTAAERKWLLDLGGEELAAADTAMSLWLPPVQPDRLPRQGCHPGDSRTRRSILTHWRDAGKQNQRRGY